MRRRRTISAIGSCRTRHTFLSCDRRSGVAWSRRAMRDEKNSAPSVARLQRRDGFLRRASHAARAEQVSAAAARHTKERRGRRRFEERIGRGHVRQHHARESRREGESLTRDRAAQRVVVHHVDDGNLGVAETAQCPATGSSARCAAGATISQSRQAEGTRTVVTAAVRAARPGWPAASRYSAVLLPFAPAIPRRADSASRRRAHGPRLRRPEAAAGLTTRRRAKSWRPPPRSRPPP